MRTVILLLIVVFCLSFAEKADAQACGSFRIEIAVRTLDGQPIGNAAIGFLPITKDETYGKKFVAYPTDRSLFSAVFEEGRSAEEFQRLVVSAKGYKTAANEIKFASCSKLRIVVKLAAKGSTAESEWAFTNWLTVVTADDAGNRVDGTKITVRREAEIVKSEFSQYSGIRFELGNGKYFLRVEKEGYEPREIAVDMSRIGDLTVKASLKIKR